MKKLAQLIKERTKDNLPEDKELQRLEDIILDAVEPIILREGNSENRMVMAGAVMKAAMLIYHADLGDEGTAMLMREVGDQVEDGLLRKFDQQTTNPETIH